MNKRSGLSLALIMAFLTFPLALTASADTSFYANEFSVNTKHQGQYVTGQTATFTMKVTYGTGSIESGSVDSFHLPIDVTNATITNVVVDESLYDGPGIVSPTDLGTFDMNSMMWSGRLDVIESQGQSTHLLVTVLVDENPTGSYVELCSYVDSASFDGTPMDFTDGGDPSCSRPEIYLATQESTDLEMSARFLTHAAINNGDQIFMAFGALNVDDHSVQMNPDESSLSILLPPEMTFTNINTVYDRDYLPLWVCGEVPLPESTTFTNYLDYTLVHCSVQFSATVEPNQLLGFILQATATETFTPDEVTIPSVLLDINDPDSLPIMSGYGTGDDVFGEASSNVSRLTYEGALPAIMASMFSRQIYPTINENTTANEYPYPGSSNLQWFTRIFANDAALGSPGEQWGSPVDQFTFAVDTENFTPTEITPTVVSSSIAGNDYSDYDELSAPATNAGTFDMNTMTWTGTLETGQYLYLVIKGTVANAPGEIVSITPSITNASYQSNPVIVDSDDFNLTWRPPSYAGNYISQNSTDIEVESEFASLGSINSGDPVDVDIHLTNIGDKDTVITSMWVIDESGENLLEYDDRSGYLAFLIVAPPELDVDFDYVESQGIYCAAGGPLPPEAMSEEHAAIFGNSTLLQCFASPGAPLAMGQTHTVSLSGTANANFVDNDTAVYVGAVGVIDFGSILETEMLFQGSEGPDQLTAFLEYLTSDSNNVTTALYEAPTDPDMVTTTTAPATTAAPMPPTTPTTSPTVTTPPIVLPTQPTLPELETFILPDDIPIIQPVVPPTITEDEPSIIPTIVEDNELVRPDDPEKEKSVDPDSPFILFGDLSLTGSNVWDIIILAAALAIVGYAVHLISREDKKTKASKNY